MIRLRAFSSVVFLFLLTTPAFAGQVFVTNVKDSGGGSLRKALIDAQDVALCPKPCTVMFNIYGTPPPRGYWTIVPLSPLPVIFGDEINIDGWTQTAFGGDTNPDRPEVVLHGKYAGSYNIGIQFQGGGPGFPTISQGSVRGLGFVGWTRAAILARGWGSTPPLWLGFPIPIRGLVIAGNTIGLEAHGRTPTPNLWPIMLEWAEDCSIEGNLISANQIGVSIAYSSRIDVRKNVIGMDAARTTVFGNGSWGIYGTEVYFLTIIDNIIAGHQGAAVTIDWYPSQNSPVLTYGGGIVVRGNSMHDNGFGFDLANNGPTANDIGDIDRGVNDLQNYPTLQVQSGILFGELDSTPVRSFEIDIYETDAAAPFNQGTRYMVTIPVTTNIAGLASFYYALPPGAGTYITATATDLTTQNTSEFCDPVR